MLSAPHVLLLLVVSVCLSVWVSVSMPWAWAFVCGPEVGIDDFFFLLERVLCALDDFKFSKCWAYRHVSIFVILCVIAMKCRTFYLIGKRFPFWLCVLMSMDLRSSCLQGRLSRHPSSHVVSA